MEQLQIETLVVGQLAANCYLVYSQASKAALIIDPGDDAEHIINKITDLKLKPVSIIATHGHFDHIMAANEIKNTYKIPFSVHKADVFLVENLHQNTQYFLSLDPGPPPPIDSLIQVGDRIDLQIGHFQVIHTPGHTPGSVSLYHQESRCVFVGDVLFSNGAIGRYDFNYSSYPELKKSINTLLNLPKNTTVYPGHGSTTSIQTEQSFHI